MTKANGNGNWRTFKSREEVWALPIAEDHVVLSPLREGVDRLLPGDMIVDEAGETIPMRPRDFLAAYPPSEWEAVDVPRDRSPQPHTWHDCWMILSREHTIRIKPAAEGLYTDLFHLERDGVLVIDQTDEGEKPHVFRQAEIDAELAEGRYEEVKA